MSVEADNKKLKAQINDLKARMEQKTKEAEIWKWKRLSDVNKDVELINARAEQIAEEKAEEVLKERDALRAKLEAVRRECSCPCQCNPYLPLDEPCHCFDDLKDRILAILDGKVT